MDAWGKMDMNKKGHILVDQFQAVTRCFVSGSAYSPGPYPLNINALAENWMLWWGKAGKGLHLEKPTPSDTSCLEAPPILPRSAAVHRRGQNIPDGFLLLPKAEQPPPFLLSRKFVHENRSLHFDVNGFFCVCGWILPSHRGKKKRGLKRAALN